MPKLEFTKGNDEPPHMNGGATAGIHVSKQVKSRMYPYSVDIHTHYNCIEVYGSTELEAQKLRDLILAAIEICEVME